MSGEKTPAVAFAQLDEFPLYRIGADGSVYSLRYRRNLRPGASGNYLGLTLVHRDGSHAKRYVHRLVLEAFIGPAPAGHEARHLNGDRYDNRLVNLRWGTPLENAADKHSHGTSSRGVRNGAAKLTPAKVRLIRDRVAAGEKQKDVAADLGVSKMTVSRVVRRQLWVSV